MMTSENQFSFVLFTLEGALPAAEEITPQAASFFTSAVPPVPISFEFLGIDAVTPTSSAYVSALKRIDEIASLEKNWDSYESAPPSEAAVASARGLLSRAFEIEKGVDGDAARPFAIAPVSGGGVQIEWRGNNAAIEVEVGPEGRLGYLLIRNKEEGRSFEEADDVPDYQILALISSVVSGK